MKANNAPQTKGEEMVAEAWQCFEMRLKGMSLRAIGKAMKLNHQTVANRLEVANRLIVLPGVEEMRKVEDERLNRLLSALDHKIELGDTRAIEVAIKLLERLHKLHGLDRPELHDVTVHQIDERDRELAEMTREYMLKRDGGLRGSTPA
jgi:hypothetical protein